MAARNFGLRSRDIDKAAKNALQERALSFASVATMSDRWRQFSRWLIDTHQLKDLRWITRQHLEQYAHHIQTSVTQGQLSVATAQNYLSAVNVVMQQARQDRRVSVNPVEYAGRRTSISTTHKSARVRDGEYAGDRLRVGPLGDRMEALWTLVDAFGLRVKEGSLLDTARALAQAEKVGRIQIVYGTKGGRPRWIPIAESRQISALERAAAVQGMGRSLIPEDMNLREWRQHVYRYARKAGLNGWHGGRHAYAQRRYLMLARVGCPVVAGVTHGPVHHRHIAKSLGISVRRSKRIDRAVRLRVAEELGHGRIDVTNWYLG